MNIDNITSILPVGLWLIASALLIVIVLAVFGYHLYQRRRMVDLGVDGANFAALASQRELLQADVDALRTWIEEQKNELTELAKEREEQQIVRASLVQIEQDLAAKRQELNDMTSGLLEKVAQIELQLKEKQLQFDFLNKEISDLKLQKGELQNLGQEIERLKNERILIDTELAKLRQEASLERELLAKLRSEVNTLHTEKINLVSEIKELEDKAEKIQPLKEKFEKVKDTIAELVQEKLIKQEMLLTLEHSITSLKAQEESLKREIEKLKGEAVGTGGTVQDAYKDLFEVPPSCLDKGEYIGARKSEQEAETLHNFKENLRQAGYYFSGRVIDAFHTSLKCHSINPLTVLAGVSGTGKTLLPIRYAEFMGMHRLVMAVQPRWDSPQDMFGFYNYLEKEYKASDLSRSLVRMDPYNYKDKCKDSAWAHERMLLVLLDEMNLARTEYYFSEFLSKLELRRMINNPSDTAKRRQAELELDAGPSKRFNIWVPQNILFVGTMNEDETTQTLSDKVLDRSNVLRFGKPSDKIEQVQTVTHNTQNNYLSLKTWESWINTSEKLSEEQKINTWIQELNGALDGIGRPFGFRVQQAMSSYIANYPRVEEENRYKLAFADQVEQKILPKLRGLDMSEPACMSALKKISNTISQLDDDLLKKVFENAQQESQETGLFHWRGVTRPIED